MSVNSLSINIETVQVSLHYQSLLSPRQARTNVRFTHTQPTYHHWIRSDYYTLQQLLSMYK